LDGFTQRGGEHGQQHRGPHRRVGNLVRGHAQRDQACRGPDHLISPPEHQGAPPRLPEQLDGKADIPEFMLGHESDEGARPPQRAVDPNLVRAPKAAHQVLVIHTELHVGDADAAAPPPKMRHRRLQGFGGQVDSNGQQDVILGTAADVRLGVQPVRSVLPDAVTNAPPDAQVWTTEPPAKTAVEHQ
jgi:hypothetical protein